MRFYTTLCLLISTLLSYTQTTVPTANLLGQWAKEDLAGSSLYDNAYNEAWGLAKDGREYAVVGTTLGTHIIDVTDPSIPAEIDFVPGAAQGSSIIHRDYHNYGCYLYAVCDEGPSTLQILDVSYLPDSVSVVYDSNETLRQAHNIFIDTVAAKLYCVAASGGAAGNSALRIYDISDPLELDYLAEYNFFGGLSVSHVHDLWVENGLAYLNCGNDGFAMVDFTDPMDPQTLGILTDYAFSGYNHSGWPAKDGIHYYMADETHGTPIKVLDVSEPDDLEVVSYVPAPVEDITQTIPHNQIVACDYLYVSYYYDGLWVYDISDPSTPEPVLQYDSSTWPFDNNYRGAWGVYPFLPSGNILLVDMQEGLFVFEGVGDNCADRDTSILTCDIVNNVEEVPSADLDVVIYPQPANHFLQLRVVNPGSEQAATLRLHDLNGKEVAHWQLPTINALETNLPLPELASGMYILNIQLGSQEIIKKVIAQ